MVKWVVGLVAAFFAALFALPSSATASPPNPAAIAYTYDGQHHSGVLTYTTHERGPPATDERATGSDAESLRSLGPSACLHGTTLKATFAYDQPGRSVQTAPGSHALEKRSGSPGPGSAVAWRFDVAAKSVPNPKPVFKPNGAPDRNSPWYVSYRDADGNLQTVGNLDGVHAEVRIQQMQPGAVMSKPFGWRTLDTAKGPEWVEGTVCAGCQVFPRDMFTPGTRGAPGGPWGDW